MEFIELKVFERRLEDLAKDHAPEVLLAIQTDLLQNPERGPLIVGSGGARKARVADPARGKGKSGGFRYLYYYAVRDEQIFLLMIFGKNEQDNLNADQKKILKLNIKKVEEEGGR